MAKIKVGQIYTAIPDRGGNYNYLYEVTGLYGNSIRLASLDKVTGRKEDIGEHNILTSNFKIKYELDKTYINKLEFNKDLKELLNEE